MKKDRLLKLAKLLRADARKPDGIKFDLKVWASTKGRQGFPKQKRTLNCNTVACAVGLACLSGAFKDAGLTWKPSDDENNIVPLFAGLEEFDAVDAFFGISDRESGWLFGSSDYPPDLRQGAKGERAVAKRITDFVAGTAWPHSDA